MTVESRIYEGIAGKRLQMYCVVERGQTEGSVLAVVFFSDYKLIRWLLTPVSLVRDFDMDAPAFWRLDVNKQASFLVRK